MFLEEADFDDNDIGNDPFSRRSAAFSSQSKGIGNRGIGMSLGADGKDIGIQGSTFDDKDSSFDGDGGDGSSRARMLAQQRDIQLKRRSSAAQSGNMIRSVEVDTRGGGPNTHSQFTPAVRQFSAPKSINDASADASPDAKSEFSRPLRASIPNSNSNGRRESMRSLRRGDGDSDEEVEVRRKGGNSNNGKERTKRMESRRRFDDDEDEEEDGKYNRRGNDKWGNSNSNSNSNNRSNSRGGEESKRDKGSRGKQSEWEGGAKLDDERVGARFKNTENIRETVRTIEPLNLSDMRYFLTNPVPKGCGVVQCYIRRNKNGTNKLFPVYSIYLKEGDRFLMTSKKRPNNKTSNYLISMGEGDLNRGGDNYLGKLRSNFVGTEFQVFDNGISPKEGGADNSIRKELASVIYAANVLGSRGPRKMQVAIPAVDENNQITTWRQGGGNDQEDILSRIRDRNLRDLVYLINKPPRWNEQVGAYVLNFNGRVTMASVKNFQLVDPDEQNSVVLQFGRVGKDDFTMDLQWPMSPLQAFAITLSSFDSKIACD